MWSIPQLIQLFIMTLAPFMQVAAMANADEGCVSGPNRNANFRESLAPPTVTVSQPTNVGLTRAVLTAFVNPRGLETVARFVYGIGSNYNQTTSLVPIGNSEEPVFIDAAVTGLVAGVRYQYYLVATNSAGQGIGQITNFQTLLPFLVSTGSIPFIKDGSIDLGDCDNDGLLDVVITGNAIQGPEPFVEPIARVYRNLGNGTFTNANVILQGVYRSSGSVGDFDNDGWLDIAIAGVTNLGRRGVMAIYRNLGNFAFSNVFAIYVPVYEPAGVDWGDFNNDGKLDIIWGDRLLRNEGGGEFIDVNQSLGPPVQTIEWGDFNTDGFLDLLNGGLVYSNNADRTLTSITFSRPPFPYSSTWLDLNTDGWLDALVTGWNQRPAELYLNKRNGTFDTNIYNPGFPTTGIPFAADYDSDGTVDVFLSGDKTYLYKNLSVTNFAQVDLGLPIKGGAIAWGDMQRDGKLDFIYGGYLDTDRSRSGVGLNVLESTNARPSAPGGLAATVVGESVILSWSPGSDQETPPASLTYNVRVGFTPGGGNVVSPHADALGVRRIARRGNAGHGLQWRLMNLPHTGTYYWSVQAIDGAFTGSSFAEEQTFTATVSPKATTLQASDVGIDTARLSGVVRPNGFESLAWFEWGETTNYGGATPSKAIPSPDFERGVVHVLTNLLPNARYYFRTVISNSFGVGYGPGRMFQASNIISATALLFGGVNHGSAAWGDYNNDNWLDVIVSGSVFINGTFRGLYRNNGDGTFTLVDSGLPADLAASMVDWGDYNNDGWLDLLTVYSINSHHLVKRARVFRNNGNGTFTEMALSLAGSPSHPVLWSDLDGDGRLDILVNSTVYENNGLEGFSARAAGLPDMLYRRAAPADYDNDGDVDLLVTGTTNSYASGAVSTLYSNDGTGMFLEVEFRDSPSMTSGQASWNDYNNDGWLDVLVTGTTNGSHTGASSFLFENSQNGTFELVAIELPQVSTTGSSWGDINNDGWSDVFLSGRNASNQLVSRVCVNNQNNTFTELDLGIPGLSAGTVAWGDYDRDSRADLMVVTTGNWDPFTAFYRNVFPAGNTAPAPPAGLASVLVGNEVKLHWASAADDHTQTAGLTYNVRVGTSTGAGDIVSPISAPDGTRRVAKPGNAGHLTSFKLKRLNEGVFYWSVQAVDSAYAGSMFAGERHFVVGRPKITSVVTESGGVAIHFLGNETAAYGVFSSTNLSDWVFSGIGNMVSPGTFTFTDSDIASSPMRFYRIQSP